MEKKEIGKVIDISHLVEIFQAQEGDVEHIIGKTGMGKTYEATRRAIGYLETGNVVYTTWPINIPESYDQRDSFWRVFFSLLFFRNKFYVFEYKKNWHYVNLDEYLEDGIFQTEKFARFMASRTDCVFMLDEGQDVFDSHQKAGKIARQSITRTRHMHKKLIIISQRAQAVEVTCRGNVTWFYKCRARYFPFLPPFFTVYMTDEIDEGNNYPIWVRHDSQGTETWKAPVYHSGFARKRIFNAYDSWYMRKQMPRSQDTHVRGFSLSFFDKIRILFRNMGRWLKPKPNHVGGTNYMVKELSTGYPQVIHNDGVDISTKKAENLEHENTESKAATEVQKVTGDSVTLASVPVPPVKKRRAKITKVHVQSIRETVEENAKDGAVKNGELVAWDVESKENVTAEKVKI